MSGWAWGAFAWSLSTGGVLVPVWGVTACGLLAPFHRLHEFDKPPASVVGYSAWVVFA